MSKISKSLSRKLSLSLMLLAAPVFILSLGIFYLQSRYLIHKEAVERSNSVLQTALQRVKNFMNTIENSTDANVWMLEESFTPESMEMVTQRIVSLNPNVVGCYVSATPNVFPQYGRSFSVYSYKEGDSVSSVREVVSTSRTDRRGLLDRALQRAVGRCHQLYTGRRCLLSPCAFKHGSHHGLHQHRLPV